MRASVTKVEETKSKYGGIFYYIFFKNEEGSYKSCLFPQMRNFKRWKAVIDHFRQGNETILDNLSLKYKSLVDADSEFKMIVEAKDTSKQEKLF